MDFMEHCCPSDFLLAFSCSVFHKVIDVGGSTHAVQVHSPQETVRCGGTNPKICFTFEQTHYGETLSSESHGKSI